MRKPLILAAALATGFAAAPLAAQMAETDMASEPVAADPAADPAAEAAAPAEDAKTPKKGMFMATLSGANEPSGGDEDGTGQFHANVDADAGEFCFSLVVDKIGEVTGAHVHEGAAGKEGKVLLTVYDTMPGEEECLAPDPEVLAKMLAKPQNYYVNVHTAAYPKGAVRAQLSLGN